MSTKFAFDWKIQWKEFEKLSATNQRYYSYPFSTSRTGISYQWRAFLYLSDPAEGTHFGLFLKFLGGCADSVDNVDCRFEIISGDALVKALTAAHKYCLGGEDDWGWKKFDRFSKIELQNQYKLDRSQPLMLRFTMEIPKEAFKYRAKFPLVDVAPKWLVKQYENIDKPPSVEACIFSDIELESNDGVIFYAHKNVLQGQSKPLSIIIQRHVTENDTSIKFPALGNVALRALLRYLYVGSVVQATGLPTNVIIQLLDAAEQYDLPILKKTCIALLWRRVDKKRIDAPEIIKAADMYNLNGLKCHAICIMADNYDEIYTAVDLHDMSTNQLYHWITEYFVTRCRCRIMP